VLIAKPHTCLALEGRLLSRRAPRLDLSGRVGFTVFDGCLQGGVVAFVLVGVGFGEVRDRLNPAAVGYVLGLLGGQVGAAAVGAQPV
jgi:hypothetical protein